MALPGGTTFSDISRPADSSKLRRNSLPLDGIGPAGGSSRNCAHPSFGPAWKQVKFVPRTIGCFVTAQLLSGSGLLVSKRLSGDSLSDTDQADQVKDQQQRHE